MTTDRDEFLGALEQVLALEDWSGIGGHDDEFLSRFGTHLNDGRSAERELAELLELTRR